MLKVSTTKTRVYAVSAAILFVFMLAGAVYINPQGTQTNKYNVENTLGLSLDVLSAKVDARVAQMKLISKGLANDKHIHAWVNDGFDASQEPVLVDKLGFYVEEYGLTSASFADKNSHKYWNHEGFLRVLTPETDTWYFAYLASAKQDLVSVYYDQNKKRVDLYVNYQQTDGNGLSGIATSFNGVLNMLNDSVFAQHGTVFLVDSAGIIQVQSGSSGEKKYDQVGQDDASGPQNLQLLLGENNAKLMLKAQGEQGAQFTSSLSDENMLIGSSYIPSMAWFMVAQVPKDALAKSLSAPLTKHDE